MCKIIALLALTLPSLVPAAFAQAQATPLEVTVAQRGGKPVAIDMGTMTGEEVKRVSLGELTQGRPKAERLPGDAELAVQTTTAGPRMAVNVALYRTTVSGERSAGTEGAKVTGARSQDKRSTHRTVELRVGETSELALDGLIVTLKRPAR
jgi:hypothetical protein